MKEKARELRKNQTDAEKRLWYCLRVFLRPHRFHRQYPIGRYIVDFCSRRRKLIIEVDGGQHAERVVYDNVRTAFLEQQGFVVLRFWNNDVLANTDVVLGMILDAIGKRPDGLLLNEPSSRPSP